MIPFRLFRPAGVSPGQLRQEIFSLGGRHRGEPLAGALEELKDPRLSADRRMLLRAVVRHLSDRRIKEPASSASRTATLRPADAAYVGVLFAALGWIALVVSRMVHGG